MNHSDASFRAHQDGKDRPQHDHKKEDHLEQARHEVNQAGRDASQERKLHPAAQHVSAEHGAAGDHSAHLIMHSPFQSSARTEATVSSQAAKAEKPTVHAGEAKPHSSQALTFNLHLGNTGETHAAAEKAVFVVSQSGQILDANRQPVTGLDFFRDVPSDIKFVLERPADFNTFMPEQQKAIEETQQQAMKSFIQGDLSRSLSQSGASQALLPDISRIQPEAAANKDRVIPEEAKVPSGDRAERAQASDLLHLSPESRHAVSRINHEMQNNHHGRMSGHQVDSHLPGYQRRHHAQGEQALDRVNPRAAARDLKADQISSQKNMLSETFAPDAHDQYHTVRQASDHSYSVGRYGTHFNHMHRVFHHALPREVMDQLGHPPDYSKLSEILKEHPELMAKIQKNVEDAIKNGDIPAAMSGSFKSAESLSSLANFTNKLRGQNGEITKEELDKNLPQSVQDGLAQQEVVRGMKAGATPGETALAHQLGKDTPELTAREKIDNKPLMDAAGKYYALGMGKERMDSGDGFYWSSTDRGQTIALLAHNMASQIHTVGDCARGPRQTFDQLGFHLPRAVATSQGQMLEQSGLFREVSDPRPGEYGYRHWNSQVTRAHGGVDKGDAFIVTGRDNNGHLIGANDHHFVVPPDGGRYRGLKFLRPTEEFYQLYGNKRN